VVVGGGGRINAWICYDTTDRVGPVLIMLIYYGAVVVLVVL